MLLTLLFVLYGQASPATNSYASANMSSDLETLVSLTNSSLENTDDHKEVNVTKATSCKDVTTLEKPARLPKFLRNITGDRKLKPKDKVPDFTLPRVDGEEVTLYEVLAENDYVLIDFWATACGPCISQFPNLKEIYATYNEYAFEIVSVCTDFTKEQWKDSSEERQLPWIDVGEIHDEYLAGSISKAFRLRSLPRSYLVDTNGCILHTHLFPKPLEDFLETEYEEELEALEASKDTTMLDSTGKQNDS